jgi:hypothetical protein
MHRQSVFIVLAAIACLVFGIKEARAQSDTPKFETGVVFTAIRQNDDFYQLVQGFPPRIRHNYGVGGRFTFNLNSMVALEAELTYHPKERGLFTGGLFGSQSSENDFIGGTRTQGLFGIKVGKRGEKFGVFGKVRPGFMRFSNVGNCPGGELARCTVGGRSEFALDIGGVFEYYPTRRFVIRFDAGDTIIHYRKLTRVDIEGFPPTPQFPLKIGGGTTNNAQYSVGFGVRF